MSLKALNIDLKRTKKILGPSLIVLVMFTYVYSIQFNVLPISCNIILGLLGIIWYFLKKTGQPRNKLTQINISNLGICSVVFLVVAVNILSQFLNTTSDFSFIRIQILALISFCGAYFIGEILKRKYGTLTFERVAFYLTLAALLQILLTIWLYVMPGSLAFLQTVLRFSDLTTATMERLGDFRLIGFGTSFFSSGYIHSVVLVTIATVIRQNKINEKQQLFYLLSFLIIGRYCLKVSE